MFDRKAAAVLGMALISLLGTTVASVPASAAPCRKPVSSVSVHGRTIHLWVCDNGWHGQITGGATGDPVWLDSARNTVTGYRTIPSGATSVNTGTVGQYGGPWRACGRAFNRPEIVCTARN
ncbi:hypothetical protein AB0A63_08815 [Lentzea sp. NPDC042327]|uniref:hypothetical protein n=1 Tax=Lentzea sp. NPDC042327 TaxID=3154801 RepID=UPI0033D25FBA